MFLPGCFEGGKIVGAAGTAAGRRRLREGFFATRHGIADLTSLKDCVNSPRGVDRRALAAPLQSWLVGIATVAAAAGALLLRTQNDTWGDA